ncbi:ATP-dependent helicase [Methylobacterium sp. 88A]|uniref:UvrD-helicase domain-containing protein n=1 Tax=Methylobacterium sp. 88A TaxID=1131813 RepID=UPI00037506CB|nr:ATP-dependent helicase [Methylobacterium sp. 88A]
MIKRQTWRPIGVATMEAAALEAVKVGGSILVVAGPGTGKTELLGQRAAYLLQTETCLFPRRILAISFKRDAASNLRNRVESRCGPDLACRLDSMTFDAFAKQILDRFWRALPSHLAFGGTYGIAPFLGKDAFSELQRSAASGLEAEGHPAHWAKTLIGKNPTESGIYSVNLDAFNTAIQALTLEPLVIANHAQLLQLVQLRATLSSPTPQLGFAMIGRLAQAIVASNPLIRRALCATYGHVFLDEFQDTTSVQYDLIATIFKGSPTSLVAVGDDKQRIMGWAGAREDVFTAFSTDFLGGPKDMARIVLTQNFRSNQRIVTILNGLKRRLAPAEPDFIAVRPAPALPDEEICAILVARDQDAEASAVASRVAKTIAAGIDPRQIGLLVRQKANDWELRLGRAFAVAGLAFRNEDRDVGGAAIQDLMTEAYSRVVIDLLELLTRRHGGVLWATVMGHLATVLGTIQDDDHETDRALALSLASFHNAHRVKGIATPAAIEQKVAEIESFLQLDRLKSISPQYATGDFFDRIRTATKTFLLEGTALSGTWAQIIERFRGTGQTPLLTITKSKGLEYSLVFMLGLNDDQWWSFSKNPSEGRSVFFVAASRARDQLLMTRYRYDRNVKIAEIFQALTEAGVKEQHV